MRKIVFRLTKLRDTNSPLYKCVDYPHALVSCLVDLDQIIGLEFLKIKVCQIVNVAMVEKEKGLYIYGEHNIILSGSPGCGKTTVATILAKIMNTIGVYAPKYKKYRDSFRDSDNKQDPVAQSSPFQVISQYSRDRVRSLQNVSKALRTRNTVYQAYIRDISDASIHQSGLLEEATKYLSDYKTQKDEKMIEEALLRLSHANEQTRSIIIMINTFENNFKSVESGDSSPPMHEKEEITEIREIKPWGKIEIEKDYYNHFFHATRVDLVSGYMGQTGGKTRELLMKYRGGVVFIDEAYMMCVPNMDGGVGQDYGFQAMTEMTNFVTQEPGGIVIILAGYSDSLERNVMRTQEGMSRRFPTKIKIDNYSTRELADIFIGMIALTRWTIDPSLDIYQFFNKHEEDFPEFGSDCKTLCKNCRTLMADKQIEIIDRLANSQEVLLDAEDDPITITIAVLEGAIRMGQENRYVDKHRSSSNMSIYT